MVNHHRAQKKAQKEVKIDMSDAHVSRYLTDEEIELVEREYRFQQSIDIKSMRSAGHLRKQTNKFVRGLVTEVENGWKDKAARAKTK